MVDDCRSAVRLDDSNLKAFFRGAQASEALGLAEQGLQFCAGALKIDPKAPCFTTFHAFSRRFPHFVVDLFFTSFDPVFIVFPLFLLSFCRRFEAFPLRSDMSLDAFCFGGAGGAAGAAAAALEIGAGAACAGGDAAEGRCGEGLPAGERLGGASEVKDVGVLHGCHGLF